MHTDFKKYSAICLSICLITWFVFLNRFTQDDAFITYNYVKWALRGYGLVWFPGSTEFGYTNFFYAIVLWVVSSFGFNIPIASDGINIFSYILSFILTFFVFRLTTGSFFFSLLFSTAIFCQFTFSSYATGGLETSWHLLLFISSLILVYTIAVDKKFSLRRPLLRTFTYFLFSLILGALFLTRLDSAVYMALPSLLVLHRFLKKDRSLMNAFFLTTPFLLLLGFYFFYTLSLYDSFIPNTFYAKGKGTHFDSGWRYLRIFLEQDQWYTLVLLVFAIIPVVKTISQQKISLLKKPDFLFISSLMGSFIIGIFYLMRIGGDFMWFRLMIPPLYLLYGFGFTVIYRSYSRIFSILLALALFPISEEQRTEKPRPDHVEKPKALNVHLREWSFYSKSLKETFHTISKQKPLIFSSTAAGALPYFSDLFFIDEHGLNTKKIALTAPPWVNYPGHFIKATKDQLKELEVNIKIGHPFAQCHEPFAKQYLWVPLQNNCYLRTEYLTPHPEIDKMIAEKKLILRRG